MLELFPQAEKFLTPGKRHTQMGILLLRIESAASLVVITTPFYPRSRLIEIARPYGFSYPKADAEPAFCSQSSSPFHSFEAFSGLRWTLSVPEVVCGARRLAIIKNPVWATIRCSGRTAKPSTCHCARVSPHATGSVKFSERRRSSIQQDI